MDKLNGMKGGLIRDITPLAMRFETGAAVLVAYALVNFAARTKKVV